MAECFSSGSGGINKDYCVICRLEFEGSYVKVKETLLHYSERHGDNEMCSYLKECITTVPKTDVLVHAKCCRDFTDAKRSSSHCTSNNPTSETVVKKYIRSECILFNWKNDCLLCGKTAACDNCHLEAGKVCIVQACLYEMHCWSIVQNEEIWASEVYKVDFKAV